MLSGLIMSNADNFKNRRLRDCRLSPSHTDWISDCPYTSLLGLFYPRCKSSLGHMDYPSPSSRGHVFPSWCMS